VPKIQFKDGEKKKKKSTKRKILSSFYQRGAATNELAAFSNGSFLARLAPTVAEQPRACERRPQDTIN
jgi:hypothetical protein